MRAGEIGNSDRGERLLAGPRCRDGSRPLCRRFGAWPKPLAPLPRRGDRPTRPKSPPRIPLRWQRQTSCPEAPRETSSDLVPSPKGGRIAAPPVPRPQGFPPPTRPTRRARGARSPRPAPVVAACLRRITPPTTTPHHQPAQPESSLKLRPRRSPSPLSSPDSPSGSAPADPSSARPVAERHKCAASEARLHARHHAPQHLLHQAGHPLHHLLPSASQPSPYRHACHRLPSWDRRGPGSGQTEAKW
jgi:hypothetical protein